MSPIQRELYNKYNDIVIIDTTYNTNRFQMMLCIITVIDNNYKTRIVACAVIEDETVDTYRWILDSILNETDVSPRIVFSDSDPAIIRSIKEVFPNVQHLLCIFHIDLNLRKNLKESWVAGLRRELAAAIGLWLRGIAGALLVWRGAGSVKRS